MKLVEPSIAHSKSFGEALEEMRHAEGLAFWKDVGSPDNIEKYIWIRIEHSKGRSLPDGWIPATTYWLLDKGEFIGETTIRHELTEHLRTVGGHIGYWIRPSKRKQGYGKDILRLGLEKAKNLGIQKVLVTCDETNLASRKIIEANGGIFEEARDMGKKLPRKLLFWCDVSDA